MRSGVIRSVRGLRVGDFFTYDGEPYIVRYFLTRHMVCGDAASMKSGSPSSCKVPVRKVRRMVPVGALPLHNVRRVK